MKLWRYHTAIGEWRSVRDVTAETAQQWLAVWQADEPTAQFKLAKRKPRAAWEAKRGIPMRNMRDFDRL